MWYKAIDKWDKEYFVNTIFKIKNNREMTEYLQENGKISLSNEIIRFCRCSFVRVFFEELKNCGGRAVKCFGSC